MNTLTQLPAQKKVSATSPEIELLLSCARTKIDAPIAEQIKNLIEQGINWEHLTKTAKRHGVMPLLYQSLNNTGPNKVPQQILNQLRDNFQANTLHNLFLSQELLKILKLFEANDISAIPFKGPVLAAWAYGNLALRQFSDLDILVNKQDFPRARDLLISQGYNRCNQLYWECELTSDQGLYNIDIHWEIVPKHLCHFFSAEE
ncbi:MAG: nucleotidyltransferase family protein, partial [Merismopedia sp. SIO2A8]|nr:nucleotidyltransferase family protein [Merismopedia sp. SIO2A8]